MTPRRTSLGALALSLATVDDARARCRLPTFEAVGVVVPTGLVDPVGGSTPGTLRWAPRRPPDRPDDCDPPRADVVGRGPTSFAPALVGPAVFAWRIPVDATPGTSIEVRQLCRVPTNTVDFVVDAVTVDDRPPPIATAPVLHAPIYEPLVLETTGVCDDTPGPLPTVAPVQRRFAARLSAAVASDAALLVDVWRMPVGGDLRDDAALRLSDAVPIEVVDGRIAVIVTDPRPATIVVRAVERATGAASDVVVFDLDDPDATFVGLSGCGAAGAPTWPLLAAPAVLGATTRARRHRRVAAGRAR